MGESLTLPDACVLVVNVWVDEPAVAVIVTDVAFALCQVSVTLCPERIEGALAVRVTVGGGITCTVTVCGELLPPVPVATAE